MRFWLLSQNFWFSAILLHSFRFNAVFIFCHISKKSALLRGHFHLVRTFFGPIMRTNRGLTVLCSSIQKSEKWVPTLMVKIEG